MKKIIALTCLLFLFPVLCLTDESLLPRHQEWLEIVSPIITKTEKNVFLKLKTSEERDKFINLFWSRRDPLPDTKENEFYQEYMERLRFTDINFGRGTSKKGRDTERGFFYLLLGPPLERQIFATQSDVWPLELWYYKGEAKYGLPSYFYLIFYQPEGLGEYKLYSPYVDGPNKLLTPSMSGSAFNRQQAYRKLKEISGELASASISYLPSESPVGLTSLSSSTLISNIYNLAEKKFSDAYARTFLSYKDYVETDYTHNYIESQVDVKAFQNNGQFYIHWSLEPSKINFSSYQGKPYASFQLILRLEDLEGRTILEKEEEIPLSLSPENFQKHERQLFAFQDVLPVIPGDFQFYVFLKNKTAQDFTSYQTRISVPQENESPWLGKLLLYQTKQALPQSQRDRLKAFTFNGNQYIHNCQSQFLPRKKIGLFTQITGVDKPALLKMQLEISSAEDHAPIHRINKPLNELLVSNNNIVDIADIKPDGLTPGYYQVRLTLLDPQGNDLLSRNAPFIILTREFPVIPLVYGKIRPAFPSPEDLFLLASQYYLSGSYSEARKNLEKLLSIQDSIQAKLLLAQTLFALHKYEEALSIALPLYEDSGERDAGKVIAASYGSLGDWQKAADYLEQLLAKATEVSLLNLAGEAYYNLNLPEKSLFYLKKSLELQPDQPDIIKLKEQIEKKFEKR
ncbi:MAG: GWxTD domain-containing protein [Acidobacteriota bacterium]